MDSILHTFSGMILQDPTPEDEIAQRISRMVLDPSQQPFRTVLEDEPDPSSHPLFPVVLNRNLTEQSSVFPAEHPPPDAASVLSQDQSDHYALLWQFDEQLNAHMKEILMALDKLSSPEESVQVGILRDLADEEQWLKRTIEQIRAFATTDHVARLLKDAMLNRMEEFVSAIDCYITILGDRTQEARLGEGRRAYCTDEYFANDMASKHRASLVASLSVLVLNLFGHVTRPWCNVTLRLLSVALKESYADHRSITPREQMILNNFPTDIRTLRQAFALEAKTTVYVACPKCSCTYKPTLQGKVLVYPSNCTFRRFPNAAPCQELLVTSHVQDGESVRVPKVPFVVQDFDAFVGGLLSRPGMEEAMDRGTVLCAKDLLDDIKDGSAVSELLGPDGKAFMDGLRRSELRLVWSLSADWFNPYTNKQAGKSASVGSIAMALLNLPPGLRYRADCIYLHGVVPRDPPLEQVNHFLTPLVDQLDVAYEKGTFFTKTYQHEKGRKVRSAAPVIVTDLPGGKKITGFAMHNFKTLFCTLCELTRDRINDVNWMQWKPRDVEVLRKAAWQWKDAPSQAERNRIFTQFGVRWSELWRLRYFNPIKMVIVDGMHTLFERVVQYHSRLVLGIDHPETGEQIVSKDQLVIARSLLASNPSMSKLRMLTVPVLKALCTERGLNIFLAGGERMKKAHLLEALMTSMIPSPDRSEQITDNATLQDIVGTDYIDEDIENSARQQGQDKIKNVGDDCITKQELERIRKDIKSIIRPSWHRAPPSNLGEAGHGKLKADQWRSCIEFDLPVSLAQMWLSRDASQQVDENVKRRQKLAESTMLLATAIQWATSHVTSKTHAEQYTKCMHAYLNCLRELYPNIALRPSHHASLHIGQFLLRFGPMHGWWMFPFERVIGNLQKTNTNHKLGQMEATMLESFCAAANLKGFLQRSDNSSVVKECSAVIQRTTHSLQDGTSMIDTRKLAVDASPAMTPYTSNKRGAKPLPEKVISFLNVAKDHFRSQIPGWLTPDKVFFHHRHIICGFQYSTYAASVRDSSIFFQPINSNDFVPGVIQTIFSATTPCEKENLYREYFFLVIRRYSKPRTIQTDDPFPRHDAFGVRLWSDKLTDEPDVILSTQRICHSIGRPWADGIMALKPLDRDFGRNIS